jgi:tetratricopeptide (TPR) repeat protein
MSSFKGSICPIPPSFGLLIVIGLAVLVTTVATGKVEEGSPAIMSARELADSSTDAQKSSDAATIKDHRPYAKEAVGHYNKGIELHEHGFLSQAVTEYKAAIESDNRMGEAYSNLGVIYGAQRKYDNALECFEKASVLMPKSAVSLNGSANVLYKMGRVEEAIKKWRRVIEIDPTFKYAYADLAKALKETGHSDEAQQVLDAEPNN